MKGEEREEGERFLAYKTVKNVVKKTCLLFILCMQVPPLQGVDFKEHYQADSYSAELNLLLHLFQAQLDKSLAQSRYYRFLLLSLLGIIPSNLPTMFTLPAPLSLPPDDWAKRQLPTPSQRQHMLRQDKSLQHLADEEEAIRHLVQLLWREGVRLRQLQQLLQRLPVHAPLSEAHQQVLSPLLLVVDAEDLALSNAQLGMLQQLRRAQRWRQLMWQALIGGGALGAALLLHRGVRHWHRVDWRALWSRRVLGMHLGYSMTTLALLYPAWQTGKAVTRRVQRFWQTPADLRGHNDYRITYLVFISNPDNLQRQQNTVHTLNRCLQRLLPLLTENTASLTINTRDHRYRVVQKNDAEVVFAVPYTASNDEAHTTLTRVLTHYYKGQFPANALPTDIKYCRPDKA